MFCPLADLITESDVEQKLLWPLLSTPNPEGLGFQQCDVVTKLSIRRLEVGKGASRKLYFPDYIVVLAGLPLLIVEAKAPGESLDRALDEARLYGNELNAQFPTSLNPCLRVLACNGSELASAPIDSAIPDVVIAHAELSAANSAFARLTDLCRRVALQEHANRIRRSLRKENYARPVSLVGGSSFQDEELPPNTFGATIVGDYGHIFNPQSRQERAFIVRHAYIPSLRRQRFIEPIDRLIRAVVTPSTSGIRVLSDTGNPTELTAALRERKSLENQVLLLIGSVGVGKSTFVDYLSVVALPDDLKAKTVWVRVNLNEAPLAASVAYSWLAKGISSELRSQFANQEFDELPVLEKIFAPELNALRKGALALLDPASEAYKTRLADHIIRLQNDEIGLAKSLARYVCAGPGRLMIVVLDNCDKRTRDEQLTMFQVAQWVQKEFRALVILPLRDITFDLHRDEPPLDTAMKALTFRIEPPAFVEVLQARVRLTLEDMHANAATAQSLSYVLPNGIRVSYPASDQAQYLASILKSLYAHDRFVRQVMTGLAGRDVRRALEIFLDFCTSGHIGEDEIYKIRFFEGKHVLPLSLVARVLLRMHRRFYNGDRAYLKNLVQADPADALPDHFVRLSILHWLHARQTVKGPAGVTGFHGVSSIVHDLVQLGHDSERIRTEVQYLCREGCVVPEHLRLDAVSDTDLVRLTAAGLVHLQLMASPDYLAACAEDTWLSDEELAKRIGTRIGLKGIRGQFSRSTTGRNARELVDYLKLRAVERPAAPEIYLEGSAARAVNTLKEAESAVAATEVDVSRRLYVGNVPFDATADDLRDAFQQAGMVVTVAAMPLDPLSLKNRGFAFIEVADGRTAIEALDAQSIRLRGRLLVVNEADEQRGEGQPSAVRPSRRVSLSERLHVGNLSYSTSESTVRSLFEGHGLHPLDVYLVINRNDSRSRGYAFVSMASEQAAAQAIGALNGTIVDGRSIIVTPATPRGQRSGDDPSH
jgi:RNA recognition motif-containing protein